LLFRRGKGDLDEEKAIKMKTAKSHSSIITCECGKKILLVPDLKAMTKVIEEHAFEHGKIKEKPKEISSEVERIIQLLIIKILKEASNA
jgi:hypothetical protein